MSSFLRVRKGLPCPAPPPPGRIPRALSYTSGVQYYSGVAFIVYHNVLALPPFPSSFLFHSFAAQKVFRVCSGLGALLPVGEGHSEPTDK